MGNSYTYSAALGFKLTPEEAEYVEVIDRLWNDDYRTELFDIEQYGYDSFDNLALVLNNTTGQYGRTIMSYEGRSDGGLQSFKIEPEGTYLVPKSTLEQLLLYLSTDVGIPAEKLVKGTVEETYQALNDRLEVLLLGFVN